MKLEEKGQFPVEILYFAVTSGSAALNQHSDDFTECVLKNFGKARPGDLRWCIVIFFHHKKWRFWTIQVARSRKKKS